MPNRIVNLVQRHDRPIVRGKARAAVDRRLLRLFFITLFAWIYAFQKPGSLWMALRKILRLETELLVTA